MSDTGGNQFESSDNNDPPTSSQQEGSWKRGVFGKVMKLFIITFPVLINVPIFVLCSKGLSTKVIIFLMSIIPLFLTTSTAVEPKKNRGIFRYVRKFISLPKI